MSTEKSETTYQLAQPVDAMEMDHKMSQAESLLPRQKQGHKCCGGCCDVRRAVIIVNLVNMGLLVMGSLSLVSIKNASKNADQYTDDSVKDLLASYSSINLGLLLGLMAVQLVMSAVGAMGAYYYNKYMVGATAAAYVVGSILSLTRLDIGAFLYNALFAYPHFFLVYEIHKDVMSKQNYPYEEHSCCCV